MLHQGGGPVLLGAALLAAAAAVGALLLHRARPRRRKGPEEQQPSRQQAQFEALVQGLDMQPAEPSGPLAGCSTVISSLCVHPSSFT